MQATLVETGFTCRSCPHADHVHTQILSSCRLNQSILVHIRPFISHEDNFLGHYSHTYVQCRVVCVRHMSQWNAPYFLMEDTRVRPQMQGNGQMELTHAAHAQIASILTWIVPWHMFQGNVAICPDGKAMDMNTNMNSNDHHTCKATLSWRCLMLLVLKQPACPCSCSCKQVACSLRSFFEAGPGDTGVLALPAQVAGDGFKLFDVHGAVIVGVKHLKDHPYILQSPIMVLSLLVANMSKTMLTSCRANSWCCRCWSQTPQQSS